MGSLRVRQLSDFTFTFHFHALEKEMATHSSVLAWRIPWTEKPGRLQSMGSHRVGHDWSDLAAAAATKVLFPKLVLKFKSHQVFHLTRLLSIWCFTFTFVLFFFFQFYFIFKLYIIVFVLPNIKMNPPQVYMCSPSWTLLPPPSPYHPSGWSQCTSPKFWRLSKMLISFSN